MDPLLSKSIEDVMVLIAESEKHRKYVRTAGRIIKRMGVEAHRSLAAGERSAILRHFRRLLCDLEVQGFLRRRSEVQSIGLGDEPGYDYVHRSNETQLAAAIRS